MTPAFRARSERALQVLTADGRHLEAGQAALFVLGELGFRRFARFWSHPGLLPCVEFGYRLVANHRGQLAGLGWTDRP